MNKFKQVTTVALAVIVIFLFFQSSSSAESKKHIVPNSESAQKLILLIDDGMGAGQFALLDMAWEYGKKHGYLPKRKNAYRKALQSGTTTLISVKPDSYLVADSGCAASSISTSHNCVPQTIGMNEKLEPVEILSEFAKRHSIAVGLISDTRLTHATPAAFFGHVISRKDEDTLVKQFLSSGISLAFSVGKDLFSSKHIAELEKKHYQFVESSNDLEKASELPLLGLFGPLSMPDALQECYGTDE
jgi:alkaline phosphatase